MEKKFLNTSDQQQFFINPERMMNMKITVYLLLASLVITITAIGSLAEPVEKYPFSAEYVSSLEHNAYDHIESECTFSREELDWPRWKKIPCNPDTLIQVFPSLQMKEGWHLAGYYRPMEPSTHYMDIIEPQIFIIPDGVKLPGETLYDDDTGGLVLPEEADYNFMGIITGNGSPESYIEATEYFEIVDNYGNRIMQFMDLLDNSSWDTLQNAGSTFTGTGTVDATWDWKSDIPDSLDPVVLRNDTAIVVRYYLSSGLGTHSITKYEYLYPSDSYVPSFSWDIIATGGEGYIT
jgi:hypothetical protein